MCGKNYDRNCENLKIIHTMWIGHAGGSLKDPEVLHLFLNNSKYEKIRLILQGVGSSEGGVGGG